MVGHGSVNVSTVGTWLRVCSLIPTCRNYFLLGTCLLVYLVEEKITRSWLGIVDFNKLHIETTSTLLQNSSYLESSSERQRHKTSYQNFCQDMFK